MERDGIAVKSAGRRFPRPGPASATSSSALSAPPSTRIPSKRGERHLRGIRVSARPSSSPSSPSGVRGGCSGLAPPSVDFLDLDRQGRPRRANAPAVSYRRAQPASFATRAGASSLPSRPAPDAGCREWRRRCYRDRCRRSRQEIAPFSARAYAADRRRPLPTIVAGCVRSASRIDVRFRDWRGIFDDHMRHGASKGPENTAKLCCRAGKRRRLAGRN